MVLSKNQYKTLRKQANLNEQGGYPKTSYGTPNATQWVSTDSLHIIQLLREIRDELKKLNNK